MMIRMFNELKEGIQKQLNEYQERDWWNGSSGRMPA
jgi:hypothetical protein